MQHKETKNCVLQQKVTKNFEPIVPNQNSDRNGPKDLASVYEILATKDLNQPVNFVR